MESTSSFLASLAAFGWTAARDTAYQLHPHAGEPARIIAEFRGGYRLQTARGELPGGLAGILHETLSGEERLAVGDWVLAVMAEDRAVIRSRLERTNSIRRKAAGRAAEAQVLASNLDWAFILSSLNNDFNPARLTRTVTIVRDGGVAPVVILTKADLHDDPTAPCDDARSLLGEVPVHALSAHTGVGLEALAPYLTEAKTIALIGSSGVGKSTLVNRLGNHVALDVGPAREGDDRGRHTTTTRELIRIPAGALLIDTPGLREIGLWTDGGGLEETFKAITTFAELCRFRDCAHAQEPGCGVQAALADGRLDPIEYDDYLKLEREQKSLVERQETSARLAVKRRWKQVERQRRKAEKDE